MSKRKKTMLVSILILVILLLVLTPTFALFNFSRISNKKTTITSGNIAFTFREGDSATLENAFPTPDSKGATSTENEFDFIVSLASNTDSAIASYDVYLVANDESNTFTNEQIKFALLKNNEYILDTSETSGRKLTNIGFLRGQTTGEALILEDQPLSAGETDSYKLRIWISDDVSFNNSMESDGTVTGKYNSYTYSLKVRVEATVINSSTIFSNLNVDDAGTITGTIEDIQGLSSYAITTSQTIPNDSSSEWIEVSSDKISSTIDNHSATYMTASKITIYDFSYPTSSNGIYYIHAKNSAGQFRTKKIKVLLPGLSNLNINPNGGTYEETTAITKKILNSGETLELKTPTRTGYKFDGWEIEGEESSISGTTFTMGVGDAKITAKWKVKSYTLTIDPAGGIYNSTSSNTIIQVNHNDVETIAIPTKEGHTFTGWVKTENDSSLNGTVFKMGTSDTTLTATWVANTYPYIVKHFKQNVDGNGYTLVSGDTEEGKDLFGTRITPRVNTYIGFTSPELKTLLIAVDDTNYTKNKVEYNYQRNKYNITIDPAGGTYPDENPISIYYQATQTISNPTRAGYVFKNWTVSEGTLVDQLYTSTNSDATLTANWELAKYIVTFNPTEGTVTTRSKEVTYTKKYGDLPTPTRENYGFSGWYTKIDGGTLITADSIYEVTEDQVLYAHWAPLKYDAVHVVETYDATATCTDGRTLDESGNCQMYYANNQSKCGCSVYNSCQSSSCGVASYKSCATEACGVIYNSCSNSACGIAKYKTCQTSACGADMTRCKAYSSNPTAVNDYGTAAKCTANKPADNANYKYYCMGNTGSTLYRASCTSRYYASCENEACGVESYNTCSNTACGVASYQTCQNSACGVASYNSCPNSSCSCNTANSCTLTENNYKTYVCNGSDTIANQTCTHDEYTCPDGGHLDETGLSCIFD